MGVSGNNKGGIDFVVAPTAILARLLQQNRHMADALRRRSETVCYLGVTRRAKGVP